MALVLDPRRLLTFREVARRGSFSRAAEALALTQPAVSQQVAALERQLGERLLERGPRGLALTAAGELLLGHAEAMSERLRLAGVQLAELGEQRALELRVGAFPSALATLVPAAIARTAAAEPRLEAQAIEGTTDELVAGVRAGDLHVALCFQDARQPEREHEGTRRETLLEEPFAALLPPGHRLAGRDRRLALADLADETWMAPSRTGIIRRACVEAGFEPRITYVSRDPMANRALVAAGLAVTLSPQLLAGEMGGVHVAEVADAPRRVVYALLPATGATPLARAFVDALRTR